VTPGPDGHRWPAAVCGRRRPPHTRGMKRELFLTSEFGKACIVALQALFGDVEIPAAMMELLIDGGTPFIGTDMPPAVVANSTFDAFMTVAVCYR
jgi:hypothetical protein